MKYWIVAILALAVAVVGVLFADHVPGATENGQFTPDFWLNSYFVVMGFVVTTAAVSPLVALFVDWRSDLAWRAARLHARLRLATALREALSGYDAFLRDMAAGEHNVVPFRLDKLRRGLADFFEVYESEQATFNAEMHSAASLLRQRLLPFRRSLESTLTMVHARHSYRFYVGANTLNDLRAAFDKPALNATSILAAHPYFREYGELFVDVRLDGQHGSGVIPIHHFTPLDLAELRRAWMKFVSACPGDTDDDDAQVGIAETYDDAAQVRLHAEYARAQIREPYMAELVVAPTALLASRSWFLRLVPLRPRRVSCATEARARGAAACRVARLGLSGRCCRAATASA
jgi:hypothetical protein